MTSTSCYLLRPRHKKPFSNIVRPSKTQVRGSLTRFCIDLASWMVKFASRADSNDLTNQDSTVCEQDPGPSACRAMRLVQLLVRLWSERMKQIPIRYNAPGSIVGSNLVKSGCNAPGLTGRIDQDNNMIGFAEM